MFSARQTWIPATTASYTPLIVTANVARGAPSTANTLNFVVYEGNMTVDWGDGSNTTINATGTYSKTYANNTSLKTVTITPSTTYGLGFVSTGNRIIDVSQWGNAPISNASMMFANNRANATLFSATDTPTFAPNASTYWMFRSALNFNQDLGNWNMANVTNTAYMFSSANSFNNGGSNSIGNWNVGNVSNAYGMFISARSFNQPIGGWQPKSLTNASVMFTAATSFNNGGNSSFAGWANANNLTDTTSMFSSAYALNQPVGEINMSKVSNAFNMFQGANSFNNGGNTNINNWNTANLKDVTGMFLNATAFNSDIGNWDMSNVTTMSQMFYNASVFNNGGSNSINNWNTSNVTTLANTFAIASVFNQPIGNWNTSKVTDLSYLFYGAYLFNQNIGNWNTANVTNMTRVFNSASEFNNGGSNSINNWNTANVTNMAFAFTQSKFNQPIGNWNTANVIAMDSMFQGANTFNQNIGNWNISNVTSMYSIFTGANTFNNGGSNAINNWNTAKVTNMFGVFSDATAFNQNISGWNVGNAVMVDSMFANAASFNQNLTPWVTGITAQPSNFSTGANATWVASKSTTFPFLSGGTIRINT